MLDPIVQVSMVKLVDVELMHHTRHAVHHGLVRKTLFVSHPNGTQSAIQAVVELNWACAPLPSSSVRAHAATIAFVKLLHEVVGGSASDCESLSSISLISNCTSVLAGSLALATGGSLCLWEEVGGGNTRSAMEYRLVPHTPY